MRPNIVGLEVRVVGRDQLVVLNLTRRPIVILDRGGRPWRRIAPGDSDMWHDERVLWRDDPPPPPAGAPEDAPRFVKNWRVPGRTGETQFAIEGFLGWLPPRTTADEGPATSAFVAGAAALLLLSVAAAILLGRRGRSG